MSAATKPLLKNLREYHDNKEAFNSFLELQEEFNEYLENRDDFLEFLQLSEDFTEEKPRRGRKPKAEAKRQGRPPGKKNAPKKQAASQEAEEPVDYSDAIMEALEPETHGLNLVSLAEACGEERKTLLKDSLAALIKTKKIEKAGGKYRIPGRQAARGRPAADAKPKKEPKAKKEPRAKAPPKATAESKDYTDAIMKALDPEIHGMNLVSLAEAVGEERKTALKDSIDSLLKEGKIEKVAGNKFRIPGRVTRGRKADGEAKPERTEGGFNWRRAGTPQGLRDINARIKAQEEKPEDKQNIPMLNELRRLQAELRGQEPPVPQEEPTKEPEKQEAAQEPTKEPEKEPAQQGPPKLEAIKGGMPATIEATRTAIKAEKNASQKARLMNHMKKLKASGKETVKSEKSRAYSKKMASAFKRRRGKPGTSSSRKSR